MENKKRVATFETVSFLRLFIFLCSPIDMAALKLP
jgi:hypothetical protein